jgi:hypothetical protein
MQTLLELTYGLAYAYSLYSFLEYAGHRWLLHKMRLANWSDSKWLRRMCYNHMKLHHGSDYEHIKLQKDDDPVQLALAGTVATVVAILPVHFIDPFAAGIVVTFGVAYAFAVYFVHLEMHNRRGSWYAKTASYRYLERRHRLHHEHPHTNFTIILPLFDWVFGTQNPTRRKN